MHGADGVAAPRAGRGLANFQIPHRFDLQERTSEAVSPAAIPEDGRGASPFSGFPCLYAAGVRIRLAAARATLAASGDLRLALELFSQTGAVLWRERAETELRASGETLRRAEATPLGRLTPQELQIARFVATGASTKAVAAQLFLSPRTVDAHLRNIFRKLGITSRAQLVGLPLGEPGKSLPDVK